MGDPRDDGDGEESSLVTKKREFLEAFFKKGAEFTRELLRENDRLRRRLVQLEAELAERGGPAPSAATLKELVDKLHALEEERARLLERVASVEEAGARFGGRFEEIEQENNDLASLFVAQGQLFASLDVREVVQVLIEILLNFVGAQRFALYLVDEGGALRVFATEGVDPDALRSVTSEEEPATAAIWRAVRDGAIEVDAAACERRHEPGREPPTVCFPLGGGDARFAAIAIWCFLSQKERLEELDRRIFELLWTSGGRSLEAARFAGRAHREGGADQRSVGVFEEYEALFD